MRHFVYRLLTATALAFALLGVSAPEAAAGECNLYGSNNDCLYNWKSNVTQADGQAKFFIVDPQPTGTGYIDSFLRVQMKGYEEGFNTSARPALCEGVDCDIKTDPNYTRNLLLSAVPIVKIGGVDYRQFFLDINEPNADPKNYITLDQVEIYLSNTASLNTYSSSTGLVGATKIWDLDTNMAPDGSPLQAPSDNWINLNYGTVGGGSGKGDMVMYIPNAYFTNQTYVYLYSQFGCINKGPNKTCGSVASGGTKYGDLYPSQAGFEEWWVYNYSNGGGGNPLTPVPEPASLALLGTGLVLAARKRFRGSKTNDLK